MTASPQYSIDVLTDQPPTVSFAKPGRDTAPSPIEEVFVEASAEDDYGVEDLELVYSVNGGAEKTVKLFDGSKRLPKVTAGHTFYLEELDVEAGRLRVVLRARRRQRHGAGRQEGDERHLLRARAAARARTSSRRSRRPAAAAAAAAAAEPGRRAVGAAAADHRRDVQHPARSQDDDRREAEGELGRRRAVAVEAARAGRRPADADEQPPGRAGPAFKKITELLPQA